MITYLPAHPDAREPEPFAGTDHPMRRLTRAIAFGEAWKRDDADRVTAVFDQLARSWSEEHVDPVKASVLHDAIDRGRVPLGGLWLELGSGTGAGTRILHELGVSHVAVDLSWEMLANAPGELAPRVRADASNTPFRENAFDAILLINMLLFPTEVDRVLAPHGVIVWVNTLGDQTPIHLPPDDVADALPGTWSGVASQAGTGLWSVLRRS